MVEHPHISKKKRGITPSPMNSLFCLLNRSQAFKRFAAVLCIWTKPKPLFTQYKIISHLLKIPAVKVSVWQQLPLGSLSSRRNSGPASISETHLLFPLLLKPHGTPTSSLNIYYGGWSQPVTKTQNYHYQFQPSFLSKDIDIMRALVLWNTMGKISWDVWKESFSCG